MSEVEFDQNAYPNVCDAFRHADGSITYIVWDDDSSAENPREYDGNIATLIQCNDRCNDIDTDDAGLSEARDRLDAFERYLAMFRPDIVHYVGYWTAGDSYGWGYVTRADWEAAGYTSTVTPQQAFEQEVDIYRQWANGEVYGAHHVTVGDPIVVLGEEGAYVDGFETVEEDCWGFLGYDDRRDIAATFTDSPIVEVLW